MRLQVSLLHTVLRADFVDCSQATDKSFIMHYDLSQDATSIQNVDNSTAYVTGSHIVKVPLIPIDSQNIGAAHCTYARSCSLSMCCRMQCRP